MLPDPLQRAVDAALDTLDHTGAVPLPARRAIWDAIGPYEFDEDGYAEGLPHLRRIELVVSVVDHLLPTWQEHQPGDPLLHTILSTINAYLDGDAYADELLEAAQLLAEHVQTVEDPVARAIADTAFHAVHVTFHDEAFGTADELEEHDILDSDLSDAERDASYFAARAMPDDTARADFWRWYLTEAVPGAFNAYHNPDEA